jgi:hypothetical protein
MAETDPALVEAARLLVAEDERTKKDTARREANERLEQTLEMALTRIDGDIDRAANLFQRWCEQDDGVRNLLQPLIREAIEGRLARMPKAEAKLV